MNIPQSDTHFHHFTTVELRFNDFDMLGHLNNAAFFEITDLAKARFMEWLLKEVDWRHFDLAIVHIDCSFYAQIFPENKVGVYTGIETISQHSFVLEQKIVDADSQKTFAVVKSVFCAFDRKTLKSKELPPLLREKLNAVK